MADERNKRRYNKRPSRDGRNYRNRPDEKRRKKEKKMAKKCPHCGDGELRPRGASNASGGVSWKCRNSKCGRTVWVHNYPVRPPVPLAPVFLQIGQL